MTQSIILKAIENKLKTIDDKKAIFEGELKPEWVVWNTPNGGYLVGIMLKCGQEYMVKQINKEQDNLLSCTVTYISVLSSKAPYTVEVKLIKKGKATSILEIEIFQKSERDGRILLGCKVLAIFADYTSLRSHPVVKQFTSLPDDPGAPVFPLVSDPTDRKHERKVFWFSKRQLYPTIVPDEIAEKEAIEKINSIIQVQSSYFPEEEVKEEDIIKHNIAAIAFYSDMTAEHFRMNPKRLHSISTAFWPATMSLSIDMTQPLPNFPLQRVVTKAKTLILNQGQWAYEIEIWSHPLDAKKLNLPEGVKGVLLAISKQQALSFEIKVNLKQTSKL